jgi:preprotein translocase subunit Sec61beta
METINLIKGVLDKILYIVFFMSTLVIIRNSFLFIKHLNKPEPEPYTINPKALIYLGFAISIVITVIFTKRIIL